MSSTTPLLLALLIIFGTGIACPVTPFSAKNRGRAAIVGVLRIALLGLTLATAANYWVLLLAAVGITGFEYLFISLDPKRAERWYRWNTTISAGKLLLVLTIFGHLELVRGVNAIAMHMTETLRLHSSVAARIGPGDLHRFLLSSVGIIFAAFEANHLIAYILKRASLMPPAAPNEATETAASRPADEAASGQAVARGRLIGLIERSLAFLLTVNGALPALGLLLAAKAVARFRDLDRRDFAEYVLIGTLLSIGMAVGIGLLLRDV